MAEARQADGRGEGSKASAGDGAVGGGKLLLQLLWAATRTLASRRLLRATGVRRKQGRPGRHAGRYSGVW